MMMNVMKIQIKVKIYKLSNNMMKIEINKLFKMTKNKVRY